FSCKTPPCGGGPQSYYKLPRHGLTVLRSWEGFYTLSSPQNFWEQQMKYPDRITEIFWDVETGKFYIDD
ncbi:MAG: hypothetical protein AAF734_10890, partial [Bacteroidota bacterium]